MWQTSGASQQNTTTRTTPVCVDQLERVIEEHHWFDESIIGLMSWLLVWWVDYWFDELIIGLTSWLLVCVVNINEVRVLQMKIRSSAASQYVGQHLLRVSDGWTDELFMFCWRHIIYLLISLKSGLRSDYPAAFQHLSLLFLTSDKRQLTSASLIHQNGVSIKKSATITLYEL